MKKRFVFFYFMKNKPEGIGSAVPGHIDYWRNLDLEDYLGGPFADRSGGMITFAATDMDEVARIVSADPFMTNDLIEQKWIREWVVS